MCERPVLGVSDTGLIVGGAGGTGGGGGAGGIATEVVGAAGAGVGAGEGGVNAGVGVTGGALEKALATVGCGGKIEGLFAAAGADAYIGWYGVYGV